MIRTSAIGGLFLALAGGVQALPRPAGLDVSPSLLEISLRPGEHVEKTITLMNPGEEPLPVSARVVDWSMSTSGQVRFDDPGSQPLSCARWIAVQPSEIVVPARGRSRIEIAVQSPAGFSGTRWSAILFSLADRPGSVNGQQVVFSGQVGVTVYVTAVGTEREDLKLKECSASAEPDGAIQLRALFENPGNTALRIRLTWQIRSTDGSVPRTYREQAVSLPGLRREVITRVKDSLPAGRYRITVLARWGTKQWQASDCVLAVPAPAAATS